MNDKKEMDSVVLIRFCSRCAHFKGVRNMGSGRRGGGISSIGSQTLGLQGMTR